MENTDQSQGVDMYAPTSSSSAIRWAIRIMLTVCGLMIVAVLLSQPRVADYVQTGITKAESMLASFKSGKDQPEQVVQLAAPVVITDVTALAPIAEVETAPAYKPTVNAMPTSRVPVRRRGQSLED